MRSVRWAGVLLGAATVLSLSVAYEFLYPYARSIFVDQPSSLASSSLAAPLGGILGETTALSLLTLSVVALSHILGGAVAGSVARSAPGFNGALTAAIFVAARFLIFVVPTLVALPGGGTGLRTLSDVLIVFSFYGATLLLPLPVTALLGYIGGRMGVLAGNGSVTRTTA